jgi:hypothetical protein
MKKEFITVSIKRVLNLEILLILSLVFITKQATAQNWNQIIKTAASDRLIKSSGARGANDYYGFSVAIDGNYAVVGSYNEGGDTTEQNIVTSSGSAFVLYNNGGNWVQIKKLIASTRAANDYFGYSVAISGSYIIVGAYQEDEDASENNTLSSSGSAYIFKKDQGGTDNWGQIKKITASTRASDDKFGISVAISGDYAIVGSNLEDEDAAGNNTLSGSGSAYIFKQNSGGTDNWGLIKKVTAGTRATDDNFGISVSINGDYAIVGANLEDEDNAENNNLSESGSAYIFKQNSGGTDNWGLIKKITAGTRGTSDNFGISVSINGNYAIVGAYFEDEDDGETNTLSESGSAYIFKQSSGGTDNWGLIKKITAGTRGSSDNFGISVSINGDYAIIGSNFEDQDSAEANASTNSGSAYIYKVNQGGTDNWGLIKKRTATIRGAADNFGFSVAIYGNYAIVGSKFEDQDHNDQNTVINCGASYFFKADKSGTDGWGQIQKTVMQGRTGGDTYGYSVAIDGNYAIVGAYNDQEDANGGNPYFNTSGWGGSGSAYILKYNGSTWTQIKKITASVRAADDWFGYSVSINGDYAIVGALFESEDANESNTLAYSGSAYIFKKDQGGTDNWGQIKKITASTRAADDNFGGSVSIYGDYAIVGCGGEDQDANEANTLSGSGSAYIFKKDQGGTDNWGQIKKITAPNRAADDIFGNSVSITNGYAIVGANYEDHDAAESNSISDAGSAYIFKQDNGGTDNWGFIKKITAPNRATNDWFGCSVGITPTYAIVGAYFEDEDSNESNTLSESGSAYIFKVNQGGTDNWGQIKKLTATNREVGDYFGFSVAINGNYAIVGAFSENEDANDANTLSNSGSAYIFKQDQSGVDNWGQIKKIVASTRSAEDGFGIGVAINANHTIVGASYDGDDANEANPLAYAGSAYFFRNGCSSNSDLPNSSGTTFTGDYSFLDETGWTHYCSSTNKLLLSLKIGTSGAEVSPSGVQLQLGSSTIYTSTSSGGMIGNTNGYAIIDRRWDVNPTTQPTTNVGVKYYFTATEYSDLVTALGNLSNPTTITHVNQINMYKASGGSAFANPHTVSGTILFNGATPSTSIWKNSVQGTTDYSAEFEVSSFSGGGGGGGGNNQPLPVSLTKFSGKIMNSNAILEWTTANEINNDRFEIERSIDGNIFYKIGEVKGKGTTNQLNKYSFYDSKASELPVKNIFYRLKQFDFNGDFEYSTVIKLSLIKSTLETNTTICPNPFNEMLQISLPQFETERVNIKLANVLGKEVCSIQNLEEGKNSISIDTKHLPSGLYILSVEQNNIIATYNVMKK